MKLLAPPAWNKLSARERSKLINGCGGAGAWASFFIPNHVWGVDVYPACARHDVAYATGFPKAQADLMLLYNLVALCSCQSKWLLPLRIVRCCTYYLAVTMFGMRFYGRKVADKELLRRGR